MKAGFIGYRNFAGNLRKIFQETGKIEETIIFHPTKKVEGVKMTNNFKDLLDCDFIVIASPDSTHGDYIRRLEKYDGYIFCEKIPVISREDLKYLKEKKNEKLYFNFCQRKSEINGILEKEGKNILHVEHVCSHGFGMTEKYKENWRSRKEHAPLGVFQLTGIHFFDLLVNRFGVPKKYQFTARNESPIGDAVDNFSIGMEFDGGMTSELFFSYTSPYVFDVRIITKDRLYELNNDVFYVRGPRDSVDEKGRFMAPSVISKNKMNFHAESLKSSVDYFLNTVESKSVFKESSSERNLLSTDIFLDILEEHNKR